MTPKVWVWCWTIPACEGGDLDAIVARAKARRVGLLVKVHDGTATSGPWDPQGVSRVLIQKCLDAGVPVRAWGYNYPDVPAGAQAEVATAPEVDYIADVEVEYDGRRAEAAALVNELRARSASGCLLGYAPLPIVSYHDQAGQYEEFNRLDLACPQAYAGTGGRDAIGALQWTDDEWRAAFPGCHIEPAVYGADQEPDELRRAIGYVLGKLAEHDRAFGDGAVSVWSYQHLSDEHWAVIDEFTKEDDMDGETVKGLFREMLRSDEGAVLVQGAILHPGGYGDALELELAALRKEARDKGQPIDENALLAKAVDAVRAKLAA